MTTGIRKFNRCVGMITKSARRSSIFQNFTPITPSKFNKESAKKSRFHENHQEKLEQEKKGGVVEFNKIKSDMAKTLGLTKSFTEIAPKLTLNNSEWKKYQDTFKPKSRLIKYYDARNIIDLANLTTQEKSNGIFKMRPGASSCKVRKSFLSPKRTSKSHRKKEKDTKQAKKALTILLDNLNKNLVKKMKRTLKRKNQITHRKSNLCIYKENSPKNKKVSKLNKSVKFLLNQVQNSRSNSTLKSAYLRQFKKNKKQIKNLNLTKQFKRQGSKNQGIISGMGSNLVCKSNIKMDIQDLKLGVDLLTKNLMMERQKKGYFKGFWVIREAAKEFEDFGSGNEGVLYFFLCQE